MKKLLTITALLALAVPAAYAAPPEGKGKPESPGKSADAPGQSAEKNAAKMCKAERAANPDAFKALHGTNPNKANAFGKCVSKKAAVLKQEAENSEEARENAAKLCKAERATNPDAFKALHGTNPNKANAFGKCVSKMAKELQKKAES